MRARSPTGTPVFLKIIWYWIENRDYRSKQIFSFLMIIFSLTDAGPPKGQPIVTIPAG